MIEPTISINGRPLTAAQVMTVRCALENFVMFLKDEGLGDSEHGAAMQAAYLACFREIREMMGL